MNSNYFLYVADQTLVANAENLASFTGQLVLTNNVQQIPVWQPYLLLDKNGLAIVDTGFKPLYIHEIYTNLRTRQHNIKSELLLQAVKLSQDAQLGSVCDLTAGLGVDALLLASCGYFVTMVEQHPVLATILYYALENHLLPKENMRLIYADSAQVLNNLDSYGVNVPHVIYLDPLFNDNKKALSNKRMQLIHKFCMASTCNAELLLKQALNVALHKVVVKRDNKQAPLAIDSAPTYSKVGTTVRFDIFLINTGLRI